MVLADTSVWIDHVRKPVTLMLRLLADEQLLMHPYIIGEIALGSIKDRAKLIDDLSDLIQSEVADHAEVMTLVERYQLHGRGVGYVDAHLLAATLLTPGTRLWTHDRRLKAAAERLDVALTADE